MRRPPHERGGRTLDHQVLPQEGIRQWVLSLPYALRYHLAYDRALVGPVLDAFIRSTFAFHRRRARTIHALGRHVKLQGGGVTFVQRTARGFHLSFSRGT